MNEHDHYACELNHEEDEPRYRCQNCEQEWGLNDLHEITHLSERVEIGEVMPAGQCPDCGALCHGTSTLGPPNTPLNPPIGYRPVGSPPWFEP
jgi:hypothetical protein